MKISLVIPTRERAEFLASCLDTALRVDDPDFEVIVSDNCSRDNTAEVVAARSDPRLRYVRTSERCSMRANFENGLQAASGDYIIFIGDDDGVLPSGIAYLREFLECHRPEAVSWRWVVYIWPSSNLGHANGLIRVKIAMPYRKPWEQSPRKLLEEICTSRMGFYKTIFPATLYHGCISRQLVDRVRKIQGGTYFCGAIPDIYSCIANLHAMSRPLIWTGHPVTIFGTSPRSNGANQMSTRKISQIGSNEVKDFKEEASLDKGAAFMDVTMPCVDALSLDMLDLALAGQPKHTEIDWEAWLKRICGRLAVMPRPRYLKAMELLESYCRAKGLTGTLAKINSKIPFSGPNVLPDAKPRRQKSYLNPRKAVIAKPDVLATVADAGEMIEEILGPHHPGQGMRYVKWLGALRRARRIVAL